MVGIRSAYYSLRIVKTKFNSMEDEVDINKIIQDQQLTPYFLDLVVKNVQKNLFHSHHVRYLPKVKANKDFYDSLYSLTERLRSVVPDEYIQPTVVEALRHYTHKLRLQTRRENSDAQ